MLIEIPLSIALAGTATVVSAPGFLHTWSALTGGVAPESPASLAAPAIAIPAFLMATLVLAPDDLRDAEELRSRLLWQSIVVLWGLYLTLSALGGWFQLDPTRFAHAGMALLLGALVVRYLGQTGLALYRRCRAPG